MPCIIQSLTEYDVRSECFEYRGYSVPHSIDINDVTHTKTSDKEEYDTCVSYESLTKVFPTTESRIILKLKVAKNLGDARHGNIKCTHTYKDAMKLNLGKPDSKNEGFIEMNIRSLILIIPAIIMGHYLDELIDDRFRPEYSVPIQTFLNILIIYLLHKFNQQYTKELQVSLAGLFFSALFFGMQTNYIRNLKKLLH